MTQDVLRLPLRSLVFLIDETGNEDFGRQRHEAMVQTPSLS
jgi:hypothetical protein